MSDYYDEMLEKRARSLRGCCWLCLVMILITFLGVLFGSCKSVQYVPVETIRTEIKQIHDTIKIQDSVKNSQQMIIREADSAEIERLNTEYGFKLDKAQKTILVLRRELEQQSHSRTEVKDSIVYKDKEVQVPYPVERKLSKWEQIKIDLGGWMVGIIILSIIVFCVYLARGKVCRVFSSNIHN